MGAICWWIAAALAGKAASWDATFEGVGQHIDVDGQWSVLARDRGAHAAADAFCRAVTRPGRSCVVSRPARVFRALSDEALLKQFAHPGMTFTWVVRSVPGARDRVIFWFPRHQGWSWFEVAAGYPTLANAVFADRALDVRHPGAERVRVEVGRGVVLTHDEPIVAIRSEDPCFRTERMAEPRAALLVGTEACDGAVVLEGAAATSVYIVRVTSNPESVSEFLEAHDPLGPGEATTTVGHHLVFELPRAPDDVRLTVPDHAALVRLSPTTIAVAGRREGFTELVVLTGTHAAITRLAITGPKALDSTALKVPIGAWMPLPLDAAAEQLSIGAPSLASARRTEAGWEVRGEARGVTEAVAHVPGREPLFIDLHVGALAAKPSQRERLPGVAAPPP